MRIRFLAALLALSPVLATGQTTVVHDLNQHRNPPRAPIEPEDFLALKDFAVFSAATRDAGRELWITRYTPESTKLLKDIDPGQSSSEPFGFVALDERTALFAASTRAHGREVWTTDGTTAGTRLVRDAIPGPVGAVRATPVTLHKRHLFVAFKGKYWFDGPAGLWFTDGTAAGTGELKQDDSPNRFTYSRNRISPTDFATDGNLLFFGGGNTLEYENNIPKRNHGLRLWVTGGTTASTRLVDESSPASPRNFARIGGRIWFTACDLATGCEPWSSDGTRGGTRLEVDVVPGRAGSFPADYFDYLGDPVFVALINDRSQILLFQNNGIFRLDAGRLRDRITMGPAIVVDRALYVQVRPLSGRGYVIRRNGVNTAVILDGKVPATTFIEEPSNFVAIGGRVLLQACDRVRGCELFQVHPSIRLVADIKTGGSGAPLFLTRIPSRLSFRSRLLVSAENDEMNRHPFLVTIGFRGARAIPLVDQPLGRDSFAAGYVSFPGRRGAAFVANSGRDGERLYVSEVPGRKPTRLSVLLRRDVSPGEVFEHLGRVYFTGTDTDDAQKLFEMDRKRNVRKAGNNDDIADPLSRNRNRNNNGFRNKKNRQKKKIHLRRRKGKGRRIAALDPCNDFVEDFPDVRSDGEDSEPTDTEPEHEVLSSGGREFVVFNADDGVRGTELWAIDLGSRSKRPILLKDIAQGARSSSPRQLTVVGEQLFFVADDSLAGAELWVTDGTSSGTRLVRDILPGIDGSLPDELVEFDDGARFRCVFAAEGPEGRELWISDGTTAGTRLVADVANGPASSFPRSVVVAYDRVFFFADDGTRGFELWITDGSPGGTLLVADLAVGPNSGVDMVPGMVALGRSRLVAFFGPSRRLLVSDGTGAGTRAVTSHNFVRPSSLGVVDETLHIAAQGQSIGNELHQVDVSGLGFSRVRTYGEPCRGTGCVFPEILAVDAPHLGNRAFGVALENGRPQSNATLFLGATAADIEIGGCAMLVGLPALALPAVTDANGSAEIRLPVPNNISFRSAELFFQWAVVDPQGAFLGRFALSQGLEAELGR